jgi:hypothetical protein
MIFLWMPETKQRTLEELDLVFAVPIKKFMRYQLKEFLPWAVAHYLLGRDTQLRDLYEDRIWKATQRKEDEGGHVSGEYTPVFSGSAFEKLDKNNVVLDASDEKGEARVQKGEMQTPEIQVEAETMSISSVGTHD